MTNSVDPDQLASEEANRSGSALFAKIGHVVFSKRRVNKNLFLQNQEHFEAESFYIILGTQNQTILFK